VVGTLQICSLLDHRCWNCFFSVGILGLFCSKKRLTKFLEGNVTESSDSKGSLTSGTGVALIQGAESNQQEIARQQLALLRRHRAVP